MNNGRLERIFELGKTDESPPLPDVLPLPTLEERVSLYLKAVHGSREFTSNERRDARNIILDAMARSVCTQSDSPNAPEAPFASGIEAPSPSMPNFEVIAAHGAARLQIHPSPAVAGSRSASDEIDSEVDEPLWSVLDRKVIRNEPRQTRRFTKRTVVTFAAIAAAVAFVVPPLLSIGWFGIQTKPAENAASIAATPYGLGGTPSKMNNASAPASPSVASTVNASPPDSSFAVRQLERVDKLIASGNMPAARSMLTDAANRGNAAAAFALAATFDPIEIERLGRRDVTPDVSAARTWYEKAYKLGSTEARERLQRLSDRFPSPGPK